MKKWIKECKEEFKLMSWLIMFYLGKFKSFINKKIQHWNDCFGSVKPSENNIYLKAQLYQCENDECYKVFNSYPNDVFCSHCGNRSSYSIIETHYGNHFVQKSSASPRIVSLRKRIAEHQI